MLKMMRMISRLVLNLCCLLLATQKRVGSIKYPMEEERRVKMMKTTSRLVLNS